MTDRKSLWRIADRKWPTFALGMGHYKYGDRGQAIKYWQQAVDEGYTEAQAYINKTNQEIQSDIVRRKQESDAFWRTYNPGSQSQARTAYIPPAPSGNTTSSIQKDNEAHRQAMSAAQSAWEKQQQSDINRQHERERRGYKSLRLTLAYFNVFLI